MRTDSPSKQAPKIPSTPRRQLGFHHFACFRAYLQNIPLRECADRYLDPGLDLRVAKSTLAWIRDEITAVARREKGATIAALLKRHIVYISVSTAPTLEAFARQFPAGFYAERELAELYRRNEAKAADALEAEDAAGAARLRQASTHWLRHTHGSHAVADEVPLEVVRNNLGHASLNTTTIYVNTERIKRYREMERFAEKRLTKSMKEVG